jgi:hypothetical protein
MEKKFPPKEDINDIQTDKLSDSEDLTMLS